MVEIVSFPKQTERLHAPEHVVRFPATRLDRARKILDGQAFDDCYLERLITGRMAVDHEGKMIAVFPSEELAAGFLLAMEILHRN